jgi:DNA repair protein RecN (Recombination protein N)
MLKYLEIRQFALIEHLEVEFEKGLNLLTGETGSGKSILVDALGLLLGGKGYSEMVRTGAEKAVISGLFEVGEPALLRRKLEGAGFELEPEELIIKRELSAQGKSRAFLDRQLVPVGLLREIAPFLADVHGQNETQSLYESDSQLLFLDAFAEVEPLRDEVGADWYQFQEKWQQLQQFRRNEQERLQTLDLLTFQTQEIEKAGFKNEEEDVHLAVEHRILANADRIYQIAHQIYADLYDGETSANRLVKQAGKLLEELKKLDPSCEGMLQQLQTARIALEDVALSVREYAAGIEVNPARLDWVEGRLAEIDRLKRKYGKSVREIMAFHRKIQGELDQLQSADENIAGLTRELEVLRARFEKKARALRERRQSAARGLEKNMERELAQLAMGKTRFSVSFTDLDQSAVPAGGLPGNTSGLDQIEFLISPNPGEELKPMSRIASGGEISRIMLALKSVKTVDGRNKSLVFDEVDAGIGGQTADVVGQKLKRLSKHNQVICVTHLPQIASYADCHYFIEKRVEKGRTLTHVAPLAGKERIQEIARMISGDRLTDNVLKHAAEMIRVAGK